MQQKFWNIFTALALLAVIIIGLRHMGGIDAQPEEDLAGQPADEAMLVAEDDETLLMDLDAEPAPRVYVADSTDRDTLATADSLQHVVPADSSACEPVVQPSEPQPHETPTQHLPTDSVD